MLTRYGKARILSDELKEDGASKSPSETRIARKAYKAQAKG